MLELSERSELARLAGTALATADIQIGVQAGLVLAQLTRMTATF